MQWPCVCQRNIRRYIFFDSMATFFSPLFLLSCAHTFQHCIETDILNKANEIKRRHGKKCFFNIHRMGKKWRRRRQQQTRIETVEVKKRAEFACNNIIKTKLIAMKTLKTVANKQTFEALVYFINANDREKNTQTNLRKSGERERKKWPESGTESGMT